MNRLPEGRVVTRGPTPPGGSAVPPDFADALAQGCDQLNIHAGSSDRERLLAYLEMLQRWNRVYNLTAIRDPRQMLTQHLLDCLSVVGPLQRALSEGSPPPTHQPVVLDVGSGAGLPGLVLALAWSALEVDLVEPVGKKAAFLRQSVSELGLVGRVRVHGCRIQEVKLPSVPDLAICRAFASLAEFVRLIAPLVAPSTRVFAMKGQRHEIEAEAAELAPPWQVVETVSLSVPGLDAARHLVRLGQHSESTHA